MEVLEYLEKNPLYKQQKKAYDSKNFPIMSFW